VDPYHPKTWFNETDLPEKGGGLMEKVSSSLTFFYKFVFTTVWSGGFCLGTALMFLSRNNDAQVMRWLFAAIWLLGSVVIWGMCGRLKRVRLNGTNLMISNYRYEITVPISDIAHVKQNRLVNLRPIFLTFKRETPFGHTVTFMPRRSFRMFSEDEIVVRLRRMANLGGANSA
jgi:hypothetical protein